MAARKANEQARARVLRDAGWSLRRIANELDVSISSVSVWVRDIRTRRTPGQTGPPDPETPAATTTRRCGRCRQHLPSSSFNRRGASYQAWCRECFREYFAARGDLHRRQSGASLRRRRRVGLQLVIDHLRAHTCADCGEADIVVLEFDHVAEKKDSPMLLAWSGASIAVLHQEISRCEVVCVNCHRRRTARRAGWRKASPSWRSEHCGRLPRERRNVDIAYEILERSGCVDCGTHELCILDFDHVGQKRANVIYLATSGCGIPRLMAEIAECEVRCANCHRRRTARQLGHQRWARRPKL
jgi:hypothetical protein